MICSFQTIFEFQTEKVLQNKNWKFRDFFNGVFSTSANSTNMKKHLQTI